MTEANKTIPESILETKHVSKSFGGIKAVQDCSISIEKGRITAIIGPNGSGKSTLFNVISKLFPQDKGVMHFNKNNITKKRDYEIAKLGLSRTFQEVRLFKNLTIQDHVEIAISQSDEGLLQSMFRPPNHNLQHAKQLLEQVRLDKPLSTLVTDLSYGERKLLDLAVALAKPHTLLMLDEPVAGVNPKLRKEIKQVIKSLNKQGETILVIEHDMNFVMDLAHHIIVLDEGKVIAEGKPKNIQNNKKVLSAYLGE
jgi:ABC-type branched-subunit amino acid transport system ATPase component